MSTRPDNTLEKDIEKKLKKMVERHGGLCLKWVSPGMDGVPDRIVLLPGGRVFFIELKRPKGGKLSELQKWFGRKLEALGCQYRVIWNEHELALFEFYIVMKE